MSGAPFRAATPAPSGAVLQGNLANRQASGNYSTHAHISLVLVLSIVSVVNYNSVTDVSGSACCTQQMGPLYADQSYMHVVKECVQSVFPASPRSHCICIESCKPVFFRCWPPAASVQIR